MVKSVVKGIPVGHAVTYITVPQVQQTRNFIGVFPHPDRNFVLIVEGAPADAGKEQPSLEEAVAAARELVLSGLKPTEAARLTAADTGYKKSEIYAGLISERPASAEGEQV